MKKLLLLSLTFFALNAFAQSKQDKQIILNILDKQTKAWNDGNVTTFMNGYWESDSLMYIGKGGIKYGYEGTLASYRKNYPDKATMGTLKFDILHVNFLAKNSCLVVGKWHLTRPEKGDIGGHFSLIWQKIKGKWQIIADHSS